jgi:hypothetical protein
MSAFDPKRTYDLSSLSCKQLNKGSPHPSDCRVTVISLVPVDANVILRNGDRQWQYPNRHTSSKRICQATWNNCQQIGIGDDRKHVQPRHPEDHIPSDTMSCQIAIDDCVRHAGRVFQLPSFYAAATRQRGVIASHGSIERLYVRKSNYHAKKEDAR